MNARFESGITLDSMRVTPNINRSKISNHDKALSNATIKRGPGESEMASQLIEHRLVRSTAAISTFTLLIAAMANVLGQTLAASVALVVQLIAFTAGWKSPQKLPYKPLARLLRPFFPIGEAEHQLPIRFAALVGLCFTVPALVSTLSGWHTAGIMLTLLCGAASALNAFKGVCLACLIYPRLQITRSRISAK